MNCAKCKTKITTHEWVVRDIPYCSPSCQRGKSPDLFAKLWDQRKNEWKFEHGGNRRK